MKKEKGGIKFLLVFCVFLSIILILSIFISNFEYYPRSLIISGVFICLLFLLVLKEIRKLRNLKALKVKGTILRNVPFEVKKRRLGSNHYKIIVRYTDLDGLDHIVEGYNKYKINYYYMAETVDLIVDNNNPKNNYIDIDIKRDIKEAFKTLRYYESNIKEENLDFENKEKQEEIKQKINRLKENLDIVKSELIKNELKYRRKDIIIRIIAVLIIIFELLYAIKCDVIVGIFMLMFTTMPCIACFVYTSSKRLRKGQIKYINNTLKSIIYKDIFSDYIIESGNLDENYMKANPLDILCGYDHNNSWTDYSIFNPIKLNDKIEICECLIKITTNSHMTLKYRSSFEHSYKRGTVLKIKTNFKTKFKPLVMEDSNRRTDIFAEAYDVFSFEKRNLDEIISNEGINELMKIRADFKNKINIAIENDQITLFLENCTIINEKDIDKKRKFENKIIKDVKTILEIVQLFENSELYEF